MLRDESRRYDVPFLYETTAGGSLPVIRTIADLVRSGDTITAIHGVLSGSLAFIMSQMATGMSWSAAVAQARDEGRTEPDPRDDLSGGDVARKLLTLVREAGIEMEQSEIQAESLVPDGLAEVSVDEFLAGITDSDEAWAQRMSQGRCQLVASWDRGGRGRVSIQSVAEDSPFHSLSGSENMVAIHTERLGGAPLIIRGAGGGPVLTAAGILTDILDAAEQMS